MRLQTHRFTEGLGGSYNWAHYSKANLVLSLSVVEKSWDKYEL